MKEDNKIHDKFPLIFFIFIGIFLGLFFYVIYISKAHSYLSDNSETCVNCHIMAPQYASWNHSSHREVANCNDCHVPHDNFVNKYYFKGKDGIRHASIFTARMEPQVIMIRDEGKQVVHNNCIRCHENQIIDAKLSAYVPQHHKNFEDRLCWDCHREVPHGRVNSLTSMPHAKVPLPESPLPEWLRNNKSKNNNN